MTPQAQQIAIALACGYRWYWSTDGLTPDMSAFRWKANLCLPPEDGIGKGWLGCAGETREMAEGEIAEVTRTGAFYTYAPRYLESLDAMEEAEKRLTDGEIEDYVKCLHGLCEVCDVFATAAQRAEAFLRTKGLWKENP